MSIGLVILVAVVALLLVVGYGTAVLMRKRNEALLKWKSPSGEVYAGSYGHSEYMNKTDDGHYRTSAYNIASILAGNGMAAPEN